MGAATDPPPNTGRSGGKGRFWGFWTTLPGVLAGLAAVITAVISLVTLTLSLTDGSVDTGSTDAGGQPRSTAVESTGASPSGVLARGRLTMLSGDYVDLQLGRVGSGVPNGDLGLIRAGNGDYQLTNTGGGSLAPISAQTVTKRKCVTGLEARTDTYELLSQLRTGWWLCVQTHSDDVAALRIVTLPGVGKPGFVYTYTVWK